MTDKNKQEQMMPYKFYCANGNVFCVRVNFGYYGIQPFAKNRKEKFIDIYLDENMQDLKYAKEKGKMTKDEKEALKGVVCDITTYKKMWHIAEVLSKDYPSMRVDLFCVKQKDGKYKIYFNELQPNGVASFQLISYGLTPEGLKAYNDMMHLRAVSDDKLITAGKVIKKVHRQQYRNVEKVNNIEILGKKKEDNRIVNKVNNVTINKEQKEYKDKQKLIKKKDKKNKIINLNKNNEMKKNNKANNDKNKITSKRNNIFLPLIYNNMNNMKEYSDKLRIKNKSKELYYNNFKYNKNKGYI